LNHLRKLTGDEIGELVPGNEECRQSDSGKPRLSSLTYRRRAGGVEFRILDHLGPVRKVGRNYVTRCPSCAEAGHDRSRDNLSILIEDPRFYRCWAGCSKQAIRSALGCPTDGIEATTAGD
jgi:hypothetical protein